MHERVISITTPSLRDLCTAALPEHDSATITPLFPMQSFSSPGGIPLHMGVWRNGSTSDSRSEGWEFESLCLHLHLDASLTFASHVQSCSISPAPFRVDGACEVSHFQMALSPASVDGAAANSSELAAQVLVLILQN